MVILQHGSHPTRGEWIEIFRFLSAVRFCGQSHPTRGEWIEIYFRNHPPLAHLRLTPHGVSGLKYLAKAKVAATVSSHPTRGEWIEIMLVVVHCIKKHVSPHTG